MPEPLRQSEKKTSIIAVSACSSCRYVSSSRLMLYLRVHLLPGKEEIPGSQLKNESLHTRRSCVLVHVGNCASVPEYRQPRPSVTNGLDHSMSGGRRCRRYHNLLRSLRNNVSSTASDPSALSSSSRQAWYICFSISLARYIRMEFTPPSDHPQLYNNLL